MSDRTATATNSAVEATIATYIEAWNETDAAGRQAGIVRAWAAGGLS